MHGKQVESTDQETFRTAIRLLIPLNRQSQALEVLGAVRDQVQFEPGCISSRLYRDVDEVRAIMVEERWRSHEDITRHLRSEAYRRVLLVIEMAEEPPEIRFDTIVCTQGIEIIETARQAR
jgi:quinol monooxygenase YgiN